MTKAFVVEVGTKNGTLYLGRKGKLSRIPIFWNSGKRLQDTLNIERNYGYNVFKIAEHEFNTAIVEIENIERGLRDSTAKRHTLHQFKQLRFTTRVRTPQNAVYKIELESKYISAKDRSSIRGCLFGKGKFGRTWETAGDLRRYVTCNNLFSREAFTTAVVLEILIGDDGVTTKSIRRIPLIDFYCQSPDSLKRFEQTFQSRLTKVQPKERIL